MSISGSCCRTAAPVMSTAKGRCCTIPLAGGKARGTVQDISARKLAEKQIEYLALHDGLTGLPNPRFFRDRVNSALAEAARMDTKLATLFLDLDRFKNVNDSLGHGIGTSCSRRSRSGSRIACARAIAFPASPKCPGNVLARLGGDEFTVPADHLAPRRGRRESGAAHSGRAGVTFPHRGP